jgi:hypothetical protein
MTVININCSELSVAEARLLRGLPTVGRWIITRQEHPILRGQSRLMAWDDTRRVGALVYDSCIWRPVAWGDANGTLLWPEIESPNLFDIIEELRAHDH